MKLFMFIKNLVFYFPATMFLLCFVLSIDCQQKSEDPIEILKKSDEACLKIKSIEYEEKIFNPEETIPTLIVNIKQIRADVPDSGFAPGKYFVSETLHKDDKNTIEFSILYDGKYLRVLDSSEKLVKVVKLND